MRFLLFSFSFLFFLSSKSQNLNLFEDTLHRPFIYGVASGDPDSSSVVLWTVLDTLGLTQNPTVSWEISTDSLFTTTINSGQVNTDASKDFTVKVIASGLNSGQRYFYRFSIGINTSAVGTTYTASSEMADSVKFALVSCSSLFSGYFNAYRLIAADTSLRAVLHVGDYIYDFVDEDEEIRVPQGIPSDLDETQISDWRNRHRLYLNDPDLRLARQKLPFILTWDNHDVVGSGTNLIPSAQAFMEWNPIREPSSDITQIWRKISWGKLLDIFMIDMETRQGDSTFVSGEKKIILDDQFNWLSNELSNSSAVWKFMGSEKLFSPWELGGLASLLPGSGLGRTWNGFAFHRDTLLKILSDNEVNNFVVGSGDLHFSMWSDIARNPFDSLLFNPAIGLGALGVEVMGKSISRGNFDESGIGRGLGASLIDASFNLNPQQTYINFFDHGYTVLKFTADSMQAQAIGVPILMISDSFWIDNKHSVLVNENRWNRKDISVGVKENKHNNFEVILFPNPAAEQFEIAIKSNEQASFYFQLYDAMGRIVQSGQIDSKTHTVQTSNLAKGLYHVFLFNKSVSYLAPILISQ